MSPSHGELLRALLPEVVLATGAIVLLVTDVFVRGEGERQSGRWVELLAGLTVLASAATLVWVARGGSSGGMIATDAFRLVAGLIVLGGALLGIVFSSDYLEREGLRVGEYYVLLLLSTIGMLVLVAARDLILLFVGIELMSIAVYVLTGFDRRRPRSSEAGLKYFLVGAFASAFLLYGIALLYGAAGTTSLVGIGPRVAEAAARGDPFLVAGLGLLLVGLGFKISAVPFHMWTPDAYEGAPTPVTGFMAAGVKAAAFAALLRVVTIDLAPAAEVWRIVVWWLAMLTMIVPNLIALAQEDVKRMLAYSSVAHAGYLLVGVVAGGALGRSAALFYLAVYTLMTLGAFAIVYHVAGEGDERQSLADYRGLGWRRPALGLALVVFLLSLAGFPPTGGFVGKLYLLRAAVDAREVALAVTLVVTSLVSYYYYFRVVWKMYFDEAPERVAAPGVPGSGFRLAGLACVLGILLAGLLPGPAVRALERADAGPPAPVRVEALEAAASGRSAPGELRGPTPAPADRPRIARQEAR